MFEQYCMPHLHAYADLLHEHGRIAVHHMCGELNGLLELIDRLPADANEAFTTPPVGNATLADGRTRMPSKCLIGGTNAALWLRPVEEIVSTVADDLAACPNQRGTFLTSTGALPAPVFFEKARRVVEAFETL
ncbi:MAG: hypothetical protein GVY16_03815 [Planctomycetes bacterium]|jgi:uroporphyrinogen-III decarboxylase|nr:hypothetical protein [Planctomycetota bacterium]